MTTLDQAKSQILAALAVALPGVALEAADLETPPQPELGDLAYACFAAAKTLKRSPALIAQQVAAGFVATELVERAAADGPYVNFTFNNNAFAAAVLQEILTAGEHFGRVTHDREGGRGSLLIEYGSPNTHKEFHVGHLRNVFLGLAVERLARAAGYAVIPVNYIGDVGAHVAKCLWAYRKFHAGEPLPANKGKYLGAIYAEASRLVEENPIYKEEVAEVQRRLEAQDPELTRLWQETRAWSLEELDAIFRELGAEFVRTYFESEVEEPGKRLVADLLERGIAVQSQGAVIIDLEAKGLGAFLILKSDGSALYSTKELALALQKFSEFAVDRSLHVVDNRQTLYFQQLFAALGRMDFHKPMVHLGYEFVTLQEGAMSSRKGNIVAYEDFRDELVRRVAAETRQRHEEWDERQVETTAWRVAEGAMKFGMLKSGTDRPIVFDLDAALSFDGFTGPYIQYAYARLSSIMAKAGAIGSSVETTPHPTLQTPNFTEAEYAVLRRAADLPELVRQAADRYEPALLAQYLFDLAQASNDFYRDVPVLAATGEERARRLAIVEALRQALASGLYLLGIVAPEEM